MEDFPESPFDPGHPVSPDKFQGRQKDIKKILRQMPKVINQGQTQNFFVIGKRGMGKTSFVKYAANKAAEQFQMIPIYINNDGYNSLDKLVQLLLEALFKELNKETWGEKIVKKITNNFEEIYIKGSGFKLKDKNNPLIENVKRDFTEFLINISNELKDKKGIFIIIDDINGLSEDEHFTSWYKSFTESISHDAHVPIAITLVSYPDKFDKLSLQNESFARIFQLIEIDHLEDHDIINFFKTTFKSANIKITDDKSLERMVFYSYGMPLVMQQIGESVFWESEDNIVNEHIAFIGIIDAANEIGRKQLKSKLDKIRSNTYIDIFIKLAHNSCYKFKKSEAKKILSSSELKSYDRFLKRATELGIIESIGSEKSGEYEFSNRLYFVYFMILGIKEEIKEDRIKEQKQKLENGEISNEEYDYFINSL